MADYKLLYNGWVLRRKDNARIPPDPTNADAFRYAEWVAAGNTADPADPRPRRQRSFANILADVETWYAGATAGQRAKAASVALLGAAIANGKLDELLAITGIDATEADPTP